MKNKCDKGTKCNYMHVFPNPKNEYSLALINCQNSSTKTKSFINNIFSEPRLIERKKQQQLALWSSPSDEDVQLSVPSQKSVLLKERRKRSKTHRSRNIESLMKSKSHSRNRSSPDRKRKKNKSLDIK